MSYRSNNCFDLQTIKWYFVIDSTLHSMLQQRISDYVLGGFANIVGIQKKAVGQIL